MNESNDLGGRLKIGKPQTALRTVRIIGLGAGINGASIGDTNTGSTRSLTIPSNDPTGRHHSDPAHLTTRTDPWITAISLTRKTPSAIRRETVDRKR